MDTKDDDLKMLLNASEVAATLGVSQRSVWRLSATGEIPPPVRIGRSVRWRRSTVEAWLAKEERQAVRQQRADTPIA